MSGQADWVVIVLALINVWQSVKLAEIAAKSDRRRATDRHPSSGGSIS